MPSKIVLPFNNQPYTSTIKTSSYSVPAGYYARVRSINYDLSVDSTRVCVAGSASHTCTYSNNNYWLAVAHLSRPFYISWSRTSGTGTAQLYVPSHPISTAASSGEYWHGAGTCINIASAGVTPAPTIINDVIYLVSVTSSGTFTVVIGDLTPFDGWVPTGTSLDGSKYLVELYPQLT